MVVVELTIGVNNLLIALGSHLHGRVVDFTTNGVLCLEDILIQGGGMEGIAIDASLLAIGVCGLGDGRVGTDRGVIGTLGLNDGA